MKISDPGEPDADDFRAEDDHRTMMRAEEIKGDPARIRGVKKHHIKSLRRLSGVGKTIRGLRGLR